MYTLDISQLTHSALEESGCDPSVIAKLDNHSTIALDLNNLPAIHISVEDDDDVWLWSLLGENSEELVKVRSTELLQELMQGCHFARSTQFQLATQDSELVLKVLIHPKYLTDGVVFSEALNGFFEQLERFCESLLK
ncbi:SPI-1 type III secretion system chaperone SpaK [Serratia proteamaculans]|uniref:InvB/SpaK family type III secretion system chaperone n=1 Tax=Serratia proteamaculans TaxID=28151 RepID=UPI001076B7D5|nr:SPI-1 type III secretion system chaperone SpaK [Serratia proteamaculans]TFZ48687.1 SPI-1 type III secretion system chaperone SpaK [Serratia proteamaculans]